MIKMTKKAVADEYHRIVSEIDALYDRWQPTNISIEDSNQIESELDNMERLAELWLNRKHYMEIKKVRNVNDWFESFLKSFDSEVDQVQCKILSQKQTEIFIKHLWQNDDRAGQYRGRYGNLVYKVSWRGNRGLLTVRSIFQDN